MQDFWFEDTVMLSVCAYKQVVFKIYVFYCLLKIKMKIRKKKLSNLSNNSGNTKYICFTHTQETSAFF